MGHTGLRKKAKTSMVSKFPVTVDATQIKNQYTLCLKILFHSITLFKSLDINLSILLTVFATFPIALVRRICLRIATRT